MTAGAPLRILVVGLGTSGSLEGIFARALGRTGEARVEFFDTSRYSLSLPGGSIARRAARRALSIGSRILIERGLIGHCRGNNRHDVVLLFKGMDLSRATLDLCRAAQPRTIWANYNPDDPLSVTTRGSSNQRVRDCLSFFDLYLTWSAHLAEKLRKAGCSRVDILPFGFDPDIHKPPDELDRPSGDVVGFVGAWDRQREELLSVLSRYNLRIHGDGWNRVARASGLRGKAVPRNIYGTELARAVRHAAVSLNILRPQNLASHNMRTFEIPAMGGLMLTTRSEEQNGFFPEEEACLMYSGPDELRSQVDRLLADKELASRLRGQARKIVVGHSYDQRARVLVRAFRTICDERHL